MQEIKSKMFLKDFKFLNIICLFKKVPNSRKYKLIYSNIKQVNGRLRRVRGTGMRYYKGNVLQ